MSVVAEQMARMGLFETTKVDNSEGVWELLGRVPSEKSDQWGVFMRNVLLLAHARGAMDSLDFCRYYYLVRKSVELPAGTLGPRTKKLGQSDMVLVWNWRLRFDGRGEKFLLYECARILETGFKAQAIKAGQFPIEPVSVPGATVVDVGQGEKDPVKTTRIA